MLKQSSSRSQRSKGFKVKHAVQVFVLGAVCVWLLYQVKHSHDKKIAMEERSSKLVASTVGEDDGTVSVGGNILKLGRKDLPNVHVGTDGGADSHDEDDGAEETEEAEHEEGNKQEENEEDARGGGEDEIDENDQERGDEEAERGEEMVEEDEDKERQQHDEADLVDSNDHEVDREHAEANSQEAREVHYKGDDASSAVVKENETTMESEVEHTGGEGQEVEQTENGEEKHTENREQTENDEEKQRENGEQTGNGEENHREDGEQTENGEDKHRENDEQTESSEEKHREMGEQTENGEARQMEDGEQTENGSQTVEGEKKETSEATEGIEAESKDNSSTVVIGHGAENADGGHEDDQVEQMLGTSTNGTGTTLLEQGDQVGDAGSSNSTLVGSNDQAKPQADLVIEASPNSTTAGDDNLVEGSTVAIDAKDGSLQLQNETAVLVSWTDRNSTEDAQTAVEERNPGDSTAEKGNDDGPKQEQVATEESEKGDATKATEGQEQEESSVTSSTGEDGENVLPAESTDSTAKPDALTDEEKDARTDLSTLPEMQTDTRSIEDIAAE